MSKRNQQPQTLVGNQCQKCGTVSKLLYFVRVAHNILELCNACVDDLVYGND